VGRVESLNEPFAGHISPKVTPTSLGKAPRAGRARGWTRPCGWSTAGVSRRFSS
jgi:hypothetical protein